MSIQLTDLEKRLQNLIEANLINFLPESVTQDQFARLLANALRANISTKSLIQPDVTFPIEFLLVVHPSKLEIWRKEPGLMEGLSRIIQTMTAEMGLKFLLAPTFSVASDPSLSIDGLIVRINRPANIVETQNMAPSSEDTAVRAGFLIIGGTNVFPLDQAVTNIGRRLDNQLVIDDPRISRYHAQIRYVRNHFLIFDLNSTGGTFVNGQRTTQSVLYPGDVISLAGLPIVFGQDSAPAPASKGDTAPFSPASSERATISLNKPLPKFDKPL